MAKTYVLDTSVLLASPAALLNFEEHQVVLPLVVLKELESKRQDPIVGYQARHALRLIEGLAQAGDLQAGVPVGDDGGTVRIEINHVDRSGLPEVLAKDPTHDTRILAVAKNLMSEEPEGSDPVVLVSRDLPLRLLALTVGLSAEDYRNDQIASEQQYTGKSTITVEPDLVDALHSNDEDLQVDLSMIDAPEAVVNQALLLRAGDSQTAMATVDVDKTLRLVRPREVFGLKGRSAEQHFAIDHLTNRSVKVVSLGGSAGTGKTILAIAAGLEQVMEGDKPYKRIIVFRPLHAVGQQEIGYLPGDLDEKMDPWKVAVMDALENITSTAVIEEVTDRGLIEVLPVTHIRGRTLGPDVFCILDESQNWEYHTLMSVLSRAGEGTKMVMAWDAAQRDNLHVGRHDGVSAVVERLKGEPLFAHISLVKSERSDVAEMITRCLDK